MNTYVFEYKNTEITAIIKTHCEDDAWAVLYELYDISLGDIITNQIRSNGQTEITLTIPSDGWELMSAS